MINSYVVPKYYKVNNSNVRPERTIGGKRRSRMKWLDNVTDTMKENLGKLQETGENRGACHAMVMGS